MAETACKVQDHTKALSKGLCACRDCKTCPCVSRKCGSRCTGPSNDTVRADGLQRPTYRPKRAHSGSEMEVTTALDTSDTVAPSREHRRPPSRRTKYSPFEEKASEPKRYDGSTYDYEASLRYYDLGNVDYTKTTAYRVSAVGASKASASAAQAETPQASPAYGYVNPTAWNMASKGVVAPKWDNQVEHWDAFMKAWSKHMALLASAPPTVIRHNFMLSLPEEEQKHWNDMVIQTPALTWESIRRIIDK